MADVIDEFVRVLSDGGLLRRTGLLRRRDIRGCSESDIGQIARLVSKPLPRAYVAFMRRMGRACGDFMVGTDLLFPRVLKLRSWAEELLEENSSPFRLIPSQHVFVMHQGYQFSYFDSAEGDDPVVWHYLEPEAAPRVVAESFSSWLLRGATDSVTAKGTIRD